MRAAAIPDPVGGRLAGRYTLGPRRGRGPATDVFAGWDHRLDRQVTVELYRTAARPAPRYRREREVGVLAGLDHPAVLAVHDRGRDPATGAAYVVTAALDGLTLAERIARGPQALPRVLGLGIALAGALAHLHAAGLVHRHLTPSTITMTRRDGPVLHDLDGVAALDVEPITLEQEAAPGDAVYLAPEQIAGREVGPTADVYALARVLEACLAAPATHDHADPAVPGTRTPRSLRAVLDAMTATDPERRPGTARVVDALDALLRAAPDGPAPAATDPAPPDPTPPDPTPPGPPDPAPPAPAAAPPRRPRHTRGRPHGRPHGRCRGSRRPGPRRTVVAVVLALGLAVEGAALGIGVTSAGATSADHPSGISTPARSVPR